MSKVIKNGTIVTADRQWRADVLIEGEHIAEIGEGLSGDETIDASDVPYTLSNMAADAISLLDHLDVDKAHVVGASMGGMIVQTLAIEHPERLLSVTSIMSTTASMAGSGSTPTIMAP